MGRRSRNIIHNLIFQVDQRASTEALNSIQLMQLGMADLEKYTKTLHSASKELLGEYQRGEATLEEFNQGQRELMQDFAKADAVIRDRQKNMSNLTDTVKAQGRIWVETKNGLVSYRNELAKVRAEAVATSHVGMGIGALGRTAERVTGVPISGVTFAGQEAFRAVRGIQLMSAELPLLTSKFSENRGQILGLVGGAVVLLGTLKLIEMAHKSYQEEVRKSIEIIQKESDLRKQIARDNITATEEEARANAEKAKQTLAIEEQELARLQAEFERVRAEGGQGTEEYAERGLTPFMDAVRKGLAEVADYTRLKDFNEEADAYAKSVEEQIKKVKEARIAADLYAEAVGSSAVADNTRDEARKEASKLAIQNIETELGYQRELAEAIRSATPEQVNTELARMRDELSLQYDALELLRDQFNAGIITEEDFKVAQQEVFDLIDVGTRRTEDWSTKVREAAEAREASIKAEEAAEEAFKSMMETLQQMQDAYESMGEFARDSYYIELERQKEILDAQNEYDREALEKKADHYLDMSRMDEDYYNKVAEILRDQAKKASEDQKKILKVQQDFNDKDQEALRDHMRKLYEIRRDAQEDILDAAARLDAVAVQQAIRQRDKQLDDEYYQYQEEKRRRDKDRQERIKAIEEEAQEKRQAYQDQLDDLRDAHELERNRKEEDYRIAYERERQEFDRKTAQQEADWAAEDAERAIHMARQMGIVSDGYDEIEQISEVGMDKFVATIRTKLDMLNAGYAAKNLLKNLDFNNPLFDQGGFPAPGRMGITGGHGPEFIKYFMPTQIIPMNMVPGGTNSKSYSFGDINIQGGMTNQDTAQAVIDALGSILGP